MDPTARPDEPVKEPVEDNTVNTPDPDHNLPDPLATPELPSPDSTDAGDPVLGSNPQE
jgi:hypothetical protein